ncbi:hypothetical protein STCU_11027 [Strigomonas culicis]|uniref:Uncharacterized protein n=1 Tax=Strigomonas culicis TaxID=28005 RepID=S9TIL4_9TRYP|nr:hypothetical protein STCU_11027 [Strigomonas culicis]|eukprot:EPY16729.1 hypothetical protein STCU_11027 [Strigomonas culicis]
MNEPQTMRRPEMSRPRGDAGAPAPDEVAARGVLPPSDVGAAREDQNVVIVAHGLLIRLFIGRWFHVPMEVFDTMLNPPNCSITVLERDDAAGRLIMSEKSRQLFGSDPLLQLMNFTGRESDPLWYRERFLGIVDPDDLSSSGFHVEEDDDENHSYRSAQHNSDVGAPQRFVQRRAQELQRLRARHLEQVAADKQRRRQAAADTEALVKSGGDATESDYGATAVTEEKLRKWSKEF